MINNAGGRIVLYIGRFSRFDSVILKILLLKILLYFGGSLWNAKESFFQN